MSNECRYNVIIVTVSLYSDAQHVYIHVGYELADLTVHPPPPKLSRVGSFFSYRCLVFPKNVLKGKPVLF